MLMKSKKTPTPQELYRVRKQRDEEERDALLPPGFVNHGNTCFMNSVLQGLIATPMLSDIVRSSLPDSQLPISVRRSPQLTNGHGRGGPWERPWEQGMPLGDAFLGIMEKAWKLQDERVRSSMSPKEILARLGTKYDQYLDFRQQDAHELLRHLLDAMRMEEWDIIKKRQPPPPKTKRKRAKQEPVPRSSAASTVANDASHGSHDDTNACRNDNQTHTSTKPIPEEERLTSFVDMVFGGQLASILVCETCKKVSMTYEDFNDLSLSIKPEDYERVRKRDRLKSFAKKLKQRSGFEIGTQPRASSVPASPTRKSIDIDKVFEKAITAGPRRRSLDTTEESGALLEQVESAVEVEITSTAPPPEEAPVYNGGPLNDDDDDEVVREMVKHKDNEDPWGKLSRRISVGIGLSRKDKDKDKARPKSFQQRKERERESKAIKHSSTGLDAPVEVLDIKAPIPTPAAQPTTILISEPSLITPPANDSLSPAVRRSVSQARLSPGIISPAYSPSPSPGPSIGRFPKSDASPSKAPVKLPRLAKPSREESAYLRRLLADVPSTTAAPFAGVFRTPNADGMQGNLWAKLGNVQSVEECLRMFTAVEALDGENCVGCRRCWKIDRGEYTPKGHVVQTVPEGDAEGSSESSAEETEDRSTRAAIEVPEPDQRPLALYTPAMGNVDSPGLSGLWLQVDEPPSTDDLPQAEESESLQRGQPDATDIAETPFPSPEPLATYGGFPIPSISTTAPESPLPSLTPHIIDRRVVDASINAMVEKLREKQAAHLNLSPSLSKDSLTPPPRHNGRRLLDRRSARDAESIQNTSDESSGDESDASATTSICSDASSVTSVRTSAVATASERSPSAPSRSGVPRSKQVIFRRSYKRYLIATPPPVLVVHLKRFQQVGKAPVQFFANFKKLDDFVSFPEYLDLKPFLLPKKADFGLKQKKKSSQKNASDGDGDKCMYRLYTVVVHIGNMLGGHYIAYTALPESTPDQSLSATESVSTAGTESRPPLDSRTASFQSTADVKGKKLRPPRKWCYISDTVVKLTALEEVLKAKAYICMYERI